MSPADQVQHLGQCLLDSRQALPYPALFIHQTLGCWKFGLDFLFLLQHKNILRRQLPEHLKLAIAEKIENKLFSKVLRAISVLSKSDACKMEQWFLNYHIKSENVQVPFLTGMNYCKKLKTLFAGEVTAVSGS